MLSLNAAYQEPTLQFWSKSHYPFWPIMQIRKKGGWNLKKIFSSDLANLNQTLLKWSLGCPLSKLCPSVNPITHFDCISIMMSFLTYITGFFMNFELLPILTDYAN